MAEQSQEPPNTRRGAETGLVIGDDRRVGGYAKLAENPGELRLFWAHVWQVGVIAPKHSERYEPGTGNVPGLELGRRVARFDSLIPRHVEDTQRRLLTRQSSEVPSPDEGAARTLEYHHLPLTAEAERVRVYQSLRIDRPLELGQ